MAGFRRISNELFLKYRRAHPERLVALLELDLDHHLGNVRPTREYARLWGLSHKLARKLVAEYTQAATEWASLRRAQPGHSQGTNRAHRPRGIARDFGRSGHRQGTARARPGHTTIETVLGAPPQQGGPLEQGPSLLADPDAAWVPPGELNWRAQQLNDFYATERPRRDLIRIRHDAHQAEEVTG